MRNMSYIGITGIKTATDSKALVEIVHTLDLPSSHLLMLGGLASYKGLRLGYVSDPTQYVLPSGLNKALIGNPQILNIVHYNSRHDGLLDQIKDVLDVVDCADGIQLNIPWPEPEMLAVLREETVPVVILQVSGAASEDLDHAPGRIADRLGDYEGLIDYALIDPSGGVGRGFEPEYAVAVLEALVHSGLAIQWGIAGGLGPGSLGNLEPLLQIYPELSWDAQARLRKGDGQALDLAACEAYLLEGVELLHGLPGRD